MTATTHQSYEATSAIRGVPQSEPMIWLQSGVAALLRLCDRRRQRYALLDLDARLLEDIGRSRGDALAQGSRPFWR